MKWIIIQITLILIDDVFTYKDTKSYQIRFDHISIHYYTVQLHNYKYQTTPNLNYKYQTYNLKRVEVRKYISSKGTI